jgi:hypothetical protein
MFGASPTLLPEEKESRIHPVVAWQQCLYTFWHVIQDKERDAVRQRVHTLYVTCLDF